MPLLFCNPYMLLLAAELLPVQLQAAWHTNLSAMPACLRPGHSSCTQTFSVEAYVQQTPVMALFTSMQQLEILNDILPLIVLHRHSLRRHMLSGHLSPS
jgi:hypothetical protein